MLMAARIISALFVMTFGFAWTVGQAGLETTNRNLCELVTALSPVAVRDCHVANWIVWLWGLGAVAAFIFLIVDITRWWLDRKGGRKAVADSHTDGLVEHLPNVRVADSPSALALFVGKEGDKLLPLLEGGKTVAWARQMASKDQVPLIQVPPETWRDHFLQFMPKNGDGTINQTFIKPKNNQYGSIYYDVFLNELQIRRVWPKFESEGMTNSSLAKFVSKRDSFTLTEAACLLAETEIRQDNLTGPAAGYLHDIKTRILQKKIDPVNAQPHEMTFARLPTLPGMVVKDELRNTLEISKKDLVKLANKLGVSIPGIVT